MNTLKGLTELHRISVETMLVRGGDYKNSDAVIVYVPTDFQNNEADQWPTDGSQDARILSYETTMMNIGVHTSSIPLHSLSTVTTRTNSDLTLVNIPHASNEEEIVARMEPNTYSSPVTSGSTAASLLGATPHAISTINTDQRNRKSPSSGTNNLIKSFLLKQMKVNVATLISVILAVLAVVYTILADNVAQRQVDLGMWVFCKSYPDDPVSIP
jgi:hypothetical protein